MSMLKKKKFLIPVGVLLVLAGVAVVVFWSYFSAQQRVRAAIDEFRNESKRATAEFPEIADASIAVVIGSPHRVNAYEASRKIMDRIKKDVPIWKKEYFKDGTIGWVLADKLMRSE